MSKMSQKLPSGALWAGAVRRGAARPIGGLGVGRLGMGLVGMTTALAGLVLGADLPALPAPPAPQGTVSIVPTTLPTDIRLPLDGQQNILSTKTDAAMAVVLGQPFESLSGGITLSPPADAKPIREVGKDDIVEFIEDVTNKEVITKGGAPAPREPSWRLTVSRRSFTTPMLLTSPPDPLGRPQHSIVQDTVDAVKKQYPDCQMLRHDLTNLGSHDVGMIVYRFVRGGEPKLAQRAIIQANDQLYYLIALTTPARTDHLTAEDAPEDPTERHGYETFRAVLESVHLLDRAKIRDDQVERLVHTRSWMTNLTPTKISNALLPEQWNVVLRDGKQIGWQYIVEQPDRKAAQDGIKVGMRTRLTAGGKGKTYPLEESESWMFTTINLGPSTPHHEDWSKQTALDDGLPHTAQHPWKKFTEIGSSDTNSRRVAVVKPEERAKPENAYAKGEQGDAQQPWMDTKSMYTVNVQYVGSMGDTDPVSRPLPPFYLPQAMVEMLPRLLPPNEPKKFLVACYVSDMHEVMLRYLEVGVEKQVTLAGRIMLAVPITDHVGYEGALTTHYVDLHGRYLGSYNAATKVTILPCDQRSLLEQWPDANLDRPAEVQPPPGGPLNGSPLAPSPGGAPPQINHVTPGR